MSSKYIAPQVIRLHDSDRAFGSCGPGSSPALTLCNPGSGGTEVKYRVNGFDGICVTGKSATGGCHAGK